MDAFNDFVLYIKHLGVAISPIFTQGTTALNPLVQEHPWLVLVGAFILGIAALTVFRIVSGIVVRLLMLSIVLIMGYFLFTNGGRIFGSILQLVQNKLSGS